MRLDTDIPEAAKRIGDLRETLRRQHPQTLGHIGRDVVAAAHQDFLVKARGGRGADGIRWAAVTPREALIKRRLGRTAIGVRSGALGSLANLRANVRSNVDRPGVQIEFAEQPKANFFNAERPLLPDRLPEEWYRTSHRRLQDAVDRVTAQVLTD